MSISTIAVIGYGRFGKTLEAILPKIFTGSSIYCTKRDITAAAKADLIIPAVPIGVFEEVIKSISTQLTGDHIVMDVCSVKIAPKQMMLKYLPNHVQIVGSHPMFGPGTLEQTKGSLQNLKMVVDPIRISKSDLSSIVEPFSRQGVEVIEMSSDNHDKYAAQFHFTSQFIASVLKKISIEKTPIDTASVSVLHNFLEFVQTDTLALLRDMYKYNPYCKDQYKKIQSSVEQIAHNILT